MKRFASDPTRPLAASQGISGRREGLWLLRLAATQPSRLGENRNAEAQRSGRETRSDFFTESVSSQRLPQRSPRLRVSLHPSSGPPHFEIVGDQELSADRQDGSLPISLQSRR